MSKTVSAKFGLLCLCLAAISLTGCDQLQALLGLGTKKAQDTTAPQQAAPQPEAVSSSAPAPQGPMPSDALVRIGDWTLTSEEFNDRLNLLKQQIADFKADDPASKGAVLDELIRQELLVQEAENSDIANSKTITDAVNDFRKTLLVQEEASRLTKDVMATEDDAQAYYEANKERFRTPVTWKVSEIVSEDEATAKNILVQILQGGDFAQIAQGQSRASNAAEGGKLKPFVSGHAPFEAMQTTVDTLDAGGVSGVFKGPEGYYIVKVDAKTGGDLKSFDDIKKDLVYALTMQKQQAAILAHLKDLADKEKPEYNKDLIDQVIGKVSQ